MSFLHEMKGLAKDATFYGVATALAGLVNVLLAPLLTRVFVPEDYGVIVLIQLAFSFFVVIAGVNISSGMSYYFYKYDKPEEQRSVILSSFAMIGGFSFVVASLLYVFSEPVANLLDIRKQGGVEGHNLAAYLRVTSIGLFFALLTAACQAVLRIHRRPACFLKLQVVMVAFHILSVFAFILVLNMGVVGVFWGRVISSVTGLLVGVAFIHKDLRAKLSWPILGLVLAYAIPQLPGVLVNWSQSQLGRFFINYYSSLQELGLYSIAFTISTVFILGTTAFRMAYGPYSLSIMKRDDAKQTYRQVYMLYAVVFCFLLGVVGAFAKPILMVMTPPSYHEAHDLILYFLIAAFYMGANNIVATGIWISERTIFTSYAQFISFAILLFSSFLLIPSLGALGGALSYLAGTLGQSFSYYFFAQKLWPIPYRYWKVHAMALGTFTICYAHNWVVDPHGFWGAFMWGCVTSMVISVYVFFICLSIAERKKCYDFAQIFLDAVVRKLGKERVG